MKKQELDQIFARFFNSQKKSPYPNRFKGQFPKHVSIAKSREVPIWNSQRDGTYYKSKYGAIKERIKRK